MRRHHRLTGDRGLGVEVSPRGLDPLADQQVRHRVRGVGAEGERCGVEYPEGRYRATTGERLFKDYAHDKLPIAGKTGTAQGAGQYPWNDSSAFAAFSLDDSRPYTIAAYLEKSGFGSKAAAPVVKCLFGVLAEDIEADPVLPSDPLDINSPYTAAPKEIPDRTCLGGYDGTVSE